MSVRRKQNFLNQQRLNTPDIRAIESAVSNDFDEMLKGLVTGQGKSYFINGFELNMTGAVGSSATGLQVLVADSAVLHGNSLESGTFYTVPVGTANETLNSNTNTRVSGSFVPGALNYVGLEYERVIDATTTSQAYFWNPSSKSELTKTVPAAIILKYKFIITSSIWAANVLPLAVIETDAANNVLSVEDHRPLLNRLGTAGSTTPDPTYVYPWTNHAEGRSENFWKSTSSTSPFRGGDKQIKNEKEWKDAVMSMIKEIKGTPYWYDVNAGGSIVKLRLDLNNMTMTGTGSIIHSSSIAGRLNWDSDILFNVISSRLTYTLLTNSVSTHITLADNQVAYIKLVRGVNITPSLIYINGSSVVSSVGAVSWTNNVVAGDFIKLASDLDSRYFKILSVDSASQVTLTETYPYASTGSGGAQSQYAWGAYQTNAAPSTDRHVKVSTREAVPFNEDILWLFLRQDNGGSLARVYIRGAAGGELEQGESREISDNESDDVLAYIGTPAENVSTPDYTNANGTGVAEATTIVYPAAASVTSGQSHTLNSANDSSEYYVWFNKNGAGGDPLIGGKFAIEVAIVTGNTATQVATAAAAAIGAVSDFSVVDNLDGSISIVNNLVGVTTDAANVNIGGIFSVTVNTQGAGSPNHVVVDAENLTKSIKRLDDAIGAVLAGLDDPSYDEILEVVSGAPANDNEATGPISIGTNITIPLNSRNSDIQQQYTVGAGSLGVYLNGVRLDRGGDYTEVGTAGFASSTIQTQFALIVGDVITFKAEAPASASVGGGGGAYTSVNLGTAKDANVFKTLVGNQFQFRRIQAGTNVSVTETTDTVIISATAGVGASQVDTYSANYTLTSVEDVALVANSGSDVTITLPDATAVEGKVYNIKKVDAGNNLFVKSVLGQTLDSVDIDASPLTIAVQFENITIISDGINWWII
jgi:hypothetical protein